MSHDTFHSLLSTLLAFAFAGGGIMNLAGPTPIRQSYVKWGYPTGFHYVAGVLDLAAASLMLWPDGRYYGAILALLITVAALVTLAWHREWRKTPASFIFIAGILVILI
jgi:hypothetical protein